MAKEMETETGGSETVIGAAVKVEGDLLSDGDIRIDGFVTGKIKTTKNLFVGSMAKIEADIEAANAELSGVIRGDVKVGESLTVTETGKIDGNISCSRLTIAPGARFSGTCSMPDSQVNEETSEPLPEEE